MGAASISTLMQRLNSTTTKKTPRMAASVPVSNCCVRVTTRRLEQEVVGVQRRLRYAGQVDLIAIAQVDDDVTESIVACRRQHVSERVEAGQRLQIDDVVATGSRLEATDHVDA